MLIYKLCTDGRQQVVPLPDKKTIGEQLHQLQEQVGGQIETVRIFADNDMTALVNEEGLLRGLPENECIPGLLWDIIIVGVEGDRLVGLTSLQIAKCLSLFRKGVNS